jgi:diadenosine tetraphosphate (Ap4A) HIT family hydrolase
LQVNDHSIRVVTTATSYIRLARNQTHPGYCLVILREHVPDMGDLPPHQLARFWGDVQRLGRAINEAFEPRKFDYMVMGHRMPHLHCHVFPQHAGDDPLRNVDIADGRTFLPTEAIKTSLASLRRAWDASAAGSDSL